MILNHNYTNANNSDNNTNDNSNEAAAVGPRRHALSGEKRDKHLSCLRSMSDSPHPPRMSMFTDTRKVSAIGL